MVDRTDALESSSADIDVATLRARLGWSQARLARCVGCHQSTIDAIEGGRPLSGPMSLVFERLALLSAEHALAGMPEAEVVDLLVGRGEALVSSISASA